MVRKRLKIASLLYDEVLIDDGALDILAGPEGASTFPHAPTGEGYTRWQTARERASAAGREFALVMQAQTPGASAFPVVRSPATISWMPTFEPIKQELPHGYPWMQFGHAPETREGRRLASRWNSLDERDEGLRELLPEIFVRDTVVKGANLDLASGATLQAAVSMDRLHATVVRARLARGDARRVFGSHALRVLVPDVAKADWDDIDAFRKHRGLRRYRDVLTEIEQTAWTSAASISDFEKTIWSEYGEQLRKAQEEANENFAKRLVTAAIGLAVGELAGLATGGLPVISGLAGTTLGLAVEQARQMIVERGRWVTADQALRRLTPTGRESLGQ